MLLKKTTERSGMQMSVESISILGSKMIDILGPPHLTNSENAKSKKLGFPDEVSWIYDFMGVKVKIEYGATEQARLDWSRFPQDKKPDSIKLKPIEQCEEAQIIGNRVIVNYFLKAYLYSLADDFTSHEAAIRSIKELFEEWEND